MLHKCYNGTVPELSKNITCGIGKQVRFLDPMFTMLQSWSVSNISANFLAGLMHWCLKSNLHTKMIKAYHVNVDAKKTQNPSHSRHHGFQHLRFKKTALHVIHQFKACSQPSPLIINQEPKRLNMNKWLFSSSPKVSPACIELVRWSPSAPCWAPPWHKNEIFSVLCHQR